MLRLLLIVAALILYGSLYPFDFYSHPWPAHLWAVMLRSWPGVDRYLLRDGVINVLLYLPLGVTAYLWLARRMRRLASALLAVACGVLLSTSVELIQLFDRTRTSSLFDILCNSLGTAAGVLLAFLYAVPIRRAFSYHGRQVQTAPDAFLLVLLFLGKQLYPLMPRLGLYALEIKLRSLLHPSLNAAGLAAAAAEWLCAALAVEALLDREHARRNFAVLLLLLPFRFLLAAPPPGYNDFAGALIAAGLWSLLPERPLSRFRAGAAVVVTLLVLRELVPFHFLAHAQSFTWLPFGATLESPWQSAAQIILGKVFAYGAAVWLLRRSGLHFGIAGAAVAAGLAGLEFVQLWLPGRTPELTDPVIALMMAYLLRGLEKEIAIPAPATAKTSARRFR